MINIRKLEADLWESADLLIKYQNSDYVYQRQASTLRHQKDKLAEARKRLQSKLMTEQI